MATRVVDLGQVVGPQGPQGPAGAKGATGATGPQGTPTTVNGKSGTSITLTAADVGARASSWTPTAAQVGAAKRTVVSFTAAQWGTVGSDGFYRLAIAKSQHQCTDAHYGYTVRHLVSGVLKETTWACVCLATEWRSSDSAIVLVSEDAFAGEIVFFW